MDFNVVMEFVIILFCLLVGTRYGGFGLGLVSGIGVLIFAFVFHLQPGKPPVDVLLTIMSVLGCASVLQTAGGLNVMMRFAEKILRKHPNQITFLAPITTWSLTVMCGTGHVVASVPDHLRHRHQERHPPRASDGRGINRLPDWHLRLAGFRRHRLDGRHPEQGSGLPG